MQEWEKRIRDFLAAGEGLHSDLKAALVEIDRMRELEKNYCQRLGRMSELGKHVCGWVLENCETEDFPPNDVVRDAQEIIMYADLTAAFGGWNKEAQPALPCMETDQGTFGEDLNIGDEVVVYDRYRFAIPLGATIEEFSKANDGVCLSLLKSNNKDYPIGCRVWVHRQQVVGKDTYLKKFFNGNEKDGVHFKCADHRSVCDVDTQHRVHALTSRQSGVDKIYDTFKLFGPELGLDSLDSVELLMAVEEEFDIEISDEDAAKVETVGDLVELVWRLLTQEG